MLNLYAEFEVCIYARYEDIKGGANVENLVVWGGHAMSLVMSPFDSLAIKCFCSLLPPADMGTLSSATMYLSVCLSVRHSVSCPSPKTVHLGHGYYETLID